MNWRGNSRSKDQASRDVDWRCLRYETTSIVSPSLLDAQKTHYLVLSPKEEKCRAQSLQRNHDSKFAKELVDVFTGEGRDIKTTTPKSTNP